jgi:hypothetical protein
MWLLAGSTRWIARAPWSRVRSPEPMRRGLRPASASRLKLKLIQLPSQTLAQLVFCDRIVTRVERIR